MAWPLCRGRPIIEGLPLQACWTQELRKLQACCPLTPWIMHLAMQMNIPNKQISMAVQACLICLMRRRWRWAMVCTTRRAS